MKALKLALIVSAVTIFGLAVGFMAYAEIPDPAPVPARKASTLAEQLERQYQPVLLVIGDSYAAGIDAQVTPYPEQLANRMGWHLEVDAQGGTGFVQGVPDADPPHVPFADRLKETIAADHPDIILIDGGRNDLGRPPDQVLAAADSYIHRVHAAWPRAILFVVLPSFMTPEPPDTYLSLAQGLTDISNSVSASIIDPVAEGWWQNVNLDSMIWRDHIHPNTQGEYYYAMRIVGDFARQGMFPPAIPTIAP